MAHIFNLAVQDILKETGAPVWLEDNDPSTEREFSADELRDPVIALHGLVVALCILPRQQQAFCIEQKWIFNLATDPDGKIQNALELVLDVQTRWSSTCLCSVKHSNYRKFWRLLSRRTRKI
jgi:hypothetical protein